MTSTYTCFKCGKDDTDQNKFLNCAYCHKCEHLPCKGVYGAAAANLRKKIYFCSTECSKIHSSTPAAGMDSLILEEIRKVSSEVREMKQSQLDLGAKLDNVLEEVKSMKTQFNTLKSDVEQLQDEQDAVNESVGKLQLEVDRLNRATIACNAVILGVPLIENEDVKQHVLNIAAAVDCKLPSNAIAEATRLVPKEAKRSTNRTAPIKVVFSELEHKESLFAKKKSHGLLLSSAIDPAVLEAHE